MGNNLVFPSNAQFVDTYFPTIDGVVRTVHNYASLMSKNSYSCVIAPTVDKNYVDNFPYEVIRVSGIKLPVKEYSLPTPKMTLGISEIIDSKNFKLFHAHSPFAMGRFALKEARRLGIPIISTFHSKYYDDVLRTTHSTIIAKEVVKSIVNFYSQMDSVWTVSDGTAETLHEYGYEGDVLVVDNGTDYFYPDNSDELRKLAREKFDIPSGKPILLFVGHQIWQKNLRLVIDTAAALSHRGFDFTMIVAGRGYAENKITAYAEKMNVKNSFVRFIGEVTDIDTMKGLYLSGGLFFFPSMYDNSPLVVREAAAMGLPSLLLRKTNTAERVKDGYNGFLTDDDAEMTADKIIGIFSDPAMLALAGENARRTISRHMDEIIPVIYEKYQSVIEEKQCAKV